MSGQRGTTSEPLEHKMLQADILKEREGVGRCVINVQTTKDLFQLFITQEMVEIIVKETNNRARKVLEAGDRRNPNRSKVENIGRFMVNEQWTFNTSSNNVRVSNEKSASIL